MSIKWEKEAVGKDNCNDNLYSLKKLKEKFQVEELIEDSLWVAHNNNPDDTNYCWLEFAFFDFSSSGDDDTELCLMVHGSGPTGSLKECRHTYWGKDGYIFYANKKKINTMLDWLSKYYDME